MRRKNKYGPCHAAKQIFEKYGLASSFQINTRMKKEAWAKRCWKVVLAKESADWTARLSTNSEGSQAFYRSLKQEWGKEKYLLMSDTSRAQVRGRKWRANMRCSTAPLNARLHRLDEKVNPACIQCKSGEHEDQRHVMCTCTRYSDKRAQLYLRIQALWLDGRHARRARWRRESVQWEDMGDDERTRWLLRTSQPDACRAVNYYLNIVFTRRPANAAAATAAAAAAAASAEAATAAAVAAAAQAQPST